MNQNAINTKKAKPGPKPLPVNMKRSIRLSINLSPDEVSMLSVDTESPTELNTWARELVYQELDRLRDENTVSTDVNMANRAKVTVQGEVSKKPAIAPANKVVFDSSDSLFVSDVRTTTPMLIRRSHADIMEEDGVDELTAYDILADEEQSFNDVLNLLHEKSVQERDRLRTENTMSTDGSMG